jgi:hypothetical protein
VKLPYAPLTDSAWKLASPASGSVMVSVPPVERLPPATPTSSVTLPVPVEITAASPTALMVS